MTDNNIEKKLEELAGAIDVSEDFAGKVMARIESKPQQSCNILFGQFTKYAAAAVIVFAVLLGINIIPGQNGSVVLAEMVKKLEQINNCVFEKTTTVSAEDNSTKVFNSILYYSEIGIREDASLDKDIDVQLYVNYQEGLVVRLDHKWKMYVKKDLTDEDLEKLLPVSPNRIVDLILSKGKYKELGEKEVDGILSEGFEFRDKRAMFSFDKSAVKKMVTRVWVDVSTNLPVRIEADAVTVNDLKVHVDQYGPKWDVELESDFFEPRIPADYMKPEERGFIGINVDNWPVVTVTPDGAAEKAGIKDGDVLLEFNGNSVSHLKSSEEVQIFLLGKIEQKDVLTIQRGEEVLTIEVERGPSPK
jgi:hypothetical protein